MSAVPSTSFSGLREDVEASNKNNNQYAYYDYSHDDLLSWSRVMMWKTV